jgi:four helix bundle protein
VGAHYHEAYRARSKAEFISKLAGAQQELDESLYWLQLLSDLGAGDAKNRDELIGEANQLMAILTASMSTTR